MEVDAEMTPHRRSLRIGLGGQRQCRIARRPQEGPEGTKRKLGSELAPTPSRRCRAEVRDVRSIVFDVCPPGGRLRRVTVRPWGTLWLGRSVMWMLGEDRCRAEDPFVNGFGFSLDAPHELEHSTCSLLLRQVSPMRENNEPKRLALGPARVK